MTGKNGPRTQTTGEGWRSKNIQKVWCPGQGTKQKFHSQGGVEKTNKRNKKPRGMKKML